MDRGPPPHPVGPRWHHRPQRADPALPLAPPPRPRPPLHPHPGPRRHRPLPPPHLSRNRVGGSRSEIRVTRRPPTVDRRPSTVDRRPSTVDRRPSTADADADPWTRGPRRLAGRPERATRAV